MEKKSLQETLEKVSLSDKPHDHVEYECDMYALERKPTL